MPIAFSSSEQVCNYSQTNSPCVCWHLYSDRHLTVYGVQGQPFEKCGGSPLTPTSSHKAQCRCGDQDKSGKEINLQCGPFACCLWMERESSINNRHFIGMVMGRNGHLFCVILENRGQFSYLMERVKSSLLAHLYNQETKRRNPNLSAALMTGEQQAGKSWYCRWADYIRGTCSLFKSVLSKNAFL